MKKFVIALAIVSLAASLLVTRNLIIRTAITRIIRGTLSGLEVSMKSVDIGLVKTSIRVEGLIILNPGRFEDRVMFEIPLLYVDYDLAAVFKKRIHITELVFDLKRLNVIRNADGELNLNALRLTRQKRAKDARSRSSAILIDAIHLTVGTVTYRDYAQTPSPKVVEYNIDLDERYERITDPYALGCLIVSRALYKTNISRLTGFDLGPLEAEIEGLAIGVSKTLTRKAAATLKKTEGLLKNTLRFPFGGG